MPRGLTANNAEQRFRTSSVKLIRAQLSPLQHPRTSAAKAGLDHLLLGEKGELGAREAELTTQDLDVVLAHERCTA